MGSEDDASNAAGLAAGCFAKRCGCLVSSGMAAIELALEYMDVRQGRSVLVADNCCFTIPAAIVRSGGRPVFVATRGQALPGVEAVRRSIESDTGALMAVHQYGLPFPVKRAREALPSSIAIIEDCSQAFGLRESGEPAGTHSQLVVVSLGTGKPLSIEGGGLLAGDDPAISQLMSRNRDESLASALPRSWLLHPGALASLETGIVRAGRTVENRRRLLDEAKPRLSGLDIEVWQPRMGDLPSWHRVPLIPLNPKHRSAMGEWARRRHLVQIPHRVRTSDLPMFGGSGAPRRSGRSPHFLVKPEALEELLNSLEKLC